MPDFAAVKELVISNTSSPTDTQEPPRSKRCAFSIKWKAWFMHSLIGLLLKQRVSRIIEVLLITFRGQNTRDGIATGIIIIVR